MIVYVVLMLVIAATLFSIACLLEAVRLWRSKKHPCEFCHLRPPEHRLSCPKGGGLRL